MRSLENNSQRNEPHVPPFVQAPHGDRRSRHEKEEVVGPTVLVYSNESGEKTPFVHPEILGVLNRPYHDADTVTIVYAEHEPPCEVTFKEYLELLGIDEYALYHTAIKRMQDNGSIDNAAIFRALHVHSVNERTKAAARLAKRFEAVDAHRDSTQEVTTKADSPVFVKLFTDLNIDGLDATSGMRREDFLDEIDDILVLNPAELQGDGAPESVAHPLYIGVQRSFQKKGVSKQWRAVPEHSERLMIPVVPLMEDLTDYGRNAENPKGVGYMQDLLELRAQNAKRAGKPPKDMDLPPIFQVLGKTSDQGRKRHLELATKKLLAIRDYLADRATRQSIPTAEREKYQPYLGALDLALTQVTSDYASLGRGM